MKLTAIVTLLVAANALELTKVWMGVENPRKRQFIPYTSLYEMLLGYISTSANIPYQTALWYQESWDEKTAGKSEARRYQAQAMNYSVIQHVVDE